MNIISGIILIIFHIIFVKSEQCYQTKSLNSKLICYYSKITTQNNISCKCSHIIVPSNINIETIDHLRKTTNKGIKIFITFSDFNKDLILLLNSSKVDGIELKVKKLKSKEDIREIITTLRSKIGTSLDVALSIPARAEILAKYYDFKALNNYVNFFILQTSFLGASKNFTFHPSRLSGLWDMQNIDTMVDLVNGLGAPLSKLIITSPVQAYKFVLQSTNHTAPGAPALSVESLNRDEFCDEMKSGNWTLERDQDQAGPYIFSSNKWIAFDDEMSIDIKAKYLRVRGLAGLALKDLSFDSQLKCKITLLEAAFMGLAKQARAPREAVLHSLEREILEESPNLFDTVQISPYRISRIVDVHGNFHVIRQDTRTEFQCTRQGYFVHPLSCNRFYRCVKFDQTSNDFSVFEFDCPAGLAFDEIVEVCVWPGSLSHGSPCSGSSEIAPVPKERFVCPHEPGYYADPENCRWFFACLDHGQPHLTAYEFRCPYGLVYDQSRLLCEWPWFVPSCSSGYAVASDVVYGIANQLSLDEYDGLGVLGRIDLGGIVGPLPNAHIYSNVGSQGAYLNHKGLSLKAVQSLENAGLLKSNYILTQDSGIDQNYHAGSDSNLYYVAGNNQVATSDSYQTSNDYNNYNVDSNADSGGAIIYANEGTQQHLNDVKSAYITTGLELGGVSYQTNNENQQGSAILNSGHYHSGYASGERNDYLATGSANVASYQHSSTSGLSNYQTGKSYVSNENSKQVPNYKSIGAISDQTFINFHSLGEKTILNTNEKKITTNQGTYYKASGGNNYQPTVQSYQNSLHYNDESAASSAANHYQSNDILDHNIIQTGSTNTAENIHIVGGGYSSVGGVEVVNNGEAVDYIAHVTPTPISITTVTPVPTVTVVPLPTIKTEKSPETYNGGVIANLPQLQYKIQVPSVTVRPLITQEIPAQVKQTLANSYTYQNILNQAVNKGYSYSKPLVNFEETSPQTSPSPVTQPPPPPIVTYIPPSVKPATAQVYSTTETPRGYDYPKPQINFVENTQPVKFSTPTTEVKPAVSSVTFIDSSATKTAAGYHYEKSTGPYDEELSIQHLPALNNPIVFKSVTQTPTVHSYVNSYNYNTTYTKPTVISQSNYEDNYNYVRWPTPKPQTFQEYNYPKPAIIFKEEPAVNKPPIVVPQQPIEIIYQKPLFQVPQQVVPSIIGTTPKPSVQVVDGYDYPKPAVKFNEEPKNLIPVVEEPFVAKKAYVTGHANSYQYNEQVYSNADNQIVQTTNKPIIYQQRPVDVSTIKSVVSFKDEPIKVLPDISYSQKYNYNYDYDNYDYSYNNNNNNYDNYENQEVVNEVPFTAKKAYVTGSKIIENYQAAGWEAEKSTISTPKPTYIPGGINEVVSINRKIKPKQFFFYDNQLTPKSTTITQSTTPEQIVQTYTTPTPTIHINTVTTPMTPTKEYLPVKTTVPISTVTYQPITNTQKSIRPTTIVKVNDFHPLLPAKLGAQCTCVSNTLELKRPKSLIIEEVDDYDNDGYNVGNDEGNYNYESEKVVEITPSPQITSTTTASNSDQIFIRGRKPSISISDIYLEHNNKEHEIIQAVRTGLNLVKEAAKEGVKEGVKEVGKLDIYGPSGGRVDDLIDCQRAGLFRHPTQCNKFYSCRWDCNKNKFILNVFNCPVHLTFDNNLGACNWPSQGPACSENTLLPSN